MEFGGLADVGVELSIDLILVGLLDQIVEGNEGPEAVWGVAGEARKAADGGAVGVSGEAERRPGSGGPASDGEPTRIAKRRPAGRIDRVGHRHPFAFGGIDFGAMLPSCADQQIGGVALPAIEGAGRIVAAVGALHVAIVAGDLEALEVLAGDEVGDPADRIGAIGRGRAVLQHFDPADGGHRQQIGIRSITGEPAPVHQHQRPLGAETPQVDRAAAGAALSGYRELIRIPQHRTDRWQVLDDFQHRR